MKAEIEARDLFPGLFFTGPKSRQAVSTKNIWGQKNIFIEMPEARIEDITAMGKESNENCLRIYRNTQDRICFQIRTHKTTDYFSERGEPRDMVATIYLTAPELEAVLNTALEFFNSKFQEIDTQAGSFEESTPQREMENSRDRRRGDHHSGPDSPEPKEKKPGAVAGERIETWISKYRGRKDVVNIAAWTKPLIFVKWPRGSKIGSRVIRGAFISGQGPSAERVTRKDLRISLDLLGPLMDSLKKAKRLYDENKR